MFQSFVVFTLLIVVLQVSYGFHMLSKRELSQPLFARRRLAEESKRAEFEVGVDIPEEIAKQASIYDMVLVERITAPEKSVGGIILPQIEGKDQKRLGLVLSIPSQYGLESEGGRVQEIPEIMPYKVGDIVYLRDPWGVGPKDQIIGPRCFSFHKAAHVLGVVGKT